MLSDILDPLLDLLGREIDDTNFVNTCIPEIRRRAQTVRNLSLAYEQESIHRILRLMSRFNGQHVNGELLGLDGEIVLPVLSPAESTSPKDFGADIKAQSPLETWFIEIKTRFAPAFRDRTLERLEQVIKAHPNSKGWLVIMGEVPFVHREKIKERGFMLSTLDDILTLEQIL